eukprot:COSAG04_NODE_966_length_9138_cov_6.958624_5_plen_185_part_00
MGYRLATEALAVVYSQPGLRRHGPQISAVTLGTSATGSYLVQIQFERQPSDAASMMPLRVAPAPECSDKLYFNYSSHCCSPDSIKSGTFQGIFKFGGPFTVSLNESQREWETMLPPTVWRWPAPGSWMAEAEFATPTPPKLLGLMWHPLPGCVVYDGAGTPALPGIVPVPFSRTAKSDGLSTYR